MHTDTQWQRSAESEAGSHQVRAIHPLIRQATRQTRENIRQQADSQLSEHQSNQKHQICRADPSIQQRQALNPVQQPFDRMLAPYARLSDGKVVNHRFTSSKYASSAVLDDGTRFIDQISTSLNSSH